MSSAFSGSSGHRSSKSSSESLNAILSQFEVLDGPRQDLRAYTQDLRPYNQAPGISYNTSVIHPADKESVPSGRPPLPQKPIPAGDSLPQSTLPHRASSPSSSRQDGQYGSHTPPRSHQPTNVSAWGSPANPATRLLPQSIRSWGKNLMRSPHRQAHEQYGFAPRPGLMESLSLESIDTLSSGQSSPEVVSNPQNQGAPLALFFREPSAASLANQAQLSAHASTQNSGNWPVEPEGGSMGRNQSAAQAIGFGAESASTRGLSQREMYSPERHQREADLIGSPVAATGGQLELTQHAALHLENPNYATDCQTPRHDHEEDDFALLESPFRHAAQTRPTYSSSDSVSPLDQDSASKSASDYGSYAYSEQEGLPGISQRNFSQTFYADGRQVKSHLRKRDFESELLSRLLTATAARKGARLSQNAQRTGVQHESVRGVLGTIGVQTSGLIAIVFMCLACFLLVFSAGRTQAHRVLMGRAELMQPGLEAMSHPDELLSHADMAWGTHIQPGRKSGPQQNPNLLQPQESLIPNESARNTGDEKGRSNLKNAAGEIIDPDVGANRQHERHKGDVQASNVNSVQTGEHRRMAVGLRLMSFTAIQPQYPLY